MFETLQLQQTFTNCVLMQKCSYLLLHQTEFEHCFFKVLATLPYVQKKTIKNVFVLENIFFAKLSQNVYLINKYTFNILDMSATYVVSFNSDLVFGNVWK